MEAVDLMPIRSHARWHFDIKQRKVKPSGRNISIYAWPRRCALHTQPRRMYGWYSETMRWLQLLMQMALNVSSTLDDQLLWSGKTSEV